MIFLFFILSKIVSLLTSVGCPYSNWGFSPQIISGMLNFTAIWTGTVKIPKCSGHWKSPNSFKGLIDIILSDRDNKILLVVNDNGIGLPDNDFNDYLTEPYVTTRPNGTGLGLAIVHKIIEDHNGEITIENIKESGASISFIFNKI